MIKTTQKELKRLAAQHTDITYATDADRKEIMDKEGWLDELMYSAGVYGCNGICFRGHTTGTLYVITSRTNAIYIFH